MIKMILGIIIGILIIRDIVLYRRGETANGVMMLIDIVLIELSIDFSVKCGLLVGEMIYLGTYNIMYILALISSKIAENK